MFAPKYRRKAIGEIWRKLCAWKGVNIPKAEAYPDHVHMLVEISQKINVLSFYIEKTAHLMHSSKNLLALK